VLPKKYEGLLIWWTTAPDPDQYSFYATGQDNNNVGYSNPLADSLLLAGRLTTDFAERRKIYHEFQRLEVDDPPVLVLYYPREILAVSARLTGLPHLPIRDALRWTERVRLQ
jgi:peptide/nickel transport system substrate-binding protein